MCSWQPSNAPSYNRNEIGEDRCKYHSLSRDRCNMTLKQIWTGIEWRNTTIHLVTVYQSWYHTRCYVLSNSDIFQYRSISLCTFDARNNDAANNTFTEVNGLLHPSRINAVHNSSSCNTDSSISGKLNNLSIAPHNNSTSSGRSTRKRSSNNFLIPIWQRSQWSASNCENYFEHDTAAKS